MELLHTDEVSTPPHSELGVKSEKLSVLDQILYGDADPDDDDGDPMWRSLDEDTAAIKHERSSDPWHLARSPAHRISFDCALGTSTSPVDLLAPRDVLVDAAAWATPGAEAPGAALAYAERLDEDEDEDARSTRLLADLLRVDEDEDDVVGLLGL